MSQESFALKWNFFHDSIHSTLEGEARDNNFTDVTLVSDELISYQAHQFVLSACSQRFKDLLLKHPHQHPTIYLKGIRDRELYYFLQLIYFGNATISDFHLEDLLKVIEEFKLTGFTIPKRTRKDSYLNVDDNLVKRNKQVQRKRQSRNANFEKKEVAKINNEDSWDQNKGKYVCNKCDLTYTSTSNLKRHQYSAHEGIRYECNQCNYKATTEGNLKSHIEGVHEGIRYECNQCDYKATQITNLRTHQKKKH